MENAAAAVAERFNPVDGTSINRRTKIRDQGLAEQTQNKLGWPCRVKSPGAKAPLLFVDEGGDEPRWFSSAESFAAWLQEVGQLKFNPKQDCELTNYVRIGDLYHSFGGNAAVTEYLAVESRPHAPLMEEHYYMWRPPADYQADGQKLAGLLRFFAGNMKAPKDLAITAALFLTPGWGGTGRPEGGYGVRPVGVVTAPDRGCGKTTLAKAMGKVWGGWIAVDLTQRGEEQLKERFLSPDALMKRIALIDNVKGTLSNALIEGLITEEWINGKRMYTGDARRPNTLTWLITANGVRLSRDMALRSFFIELERPRYRADWDRAVNSYLTLNADYIVADCIEVLRWGKTQAGRKKLEVSDRFPLWVEEVLTPACAHPAIAAVIREEFEKRNKERAEGVGAWAVEAGAADVLHANKLMRDECDEDKEEAEMLLQGLLERVCGPSGELYGAANLVVEYAQPITPLHGDVFVTKANDGSPRWVVVKDAEDDFFVSSDDMLKHWAAIMGKKLNAKQIKHIVSEHREAGRIVGLEDSRTRTGRGYEVSVKALNEYVSSVRAKYQAAKTQGDQPSAEGGG